MTGSVVGVSDTSSPSDDGAMGRADKMPVRMLNDRILVKIDQSEGDRRSTGGILIPATAQLGKRLAWAEVRAAGPNVRAVEDGDQVLFNPEDVYEVEVSGETFIILRERDIHAVGGGAPRRRTHGPLSLTAGGAVPSGADALTIGWGGLRRHPYDVRHVQPRRHARRGSRVPTSSG